MNWTALQFVIGVVVFAYGIGLLTDTITFRPPAAVYFATGLALLIYGLYGLSRGQESPITQSD
jgi:hypothetical protein